MQNAPLYASSNALQSQIATDVLRKALPHMRWACEEAAGEEAAALDVGCGTGDFTANTLRSLLPPCVKALVGMDVSAEMVNYASAHFQSQHMRFVQTDIAAPDLCSTPLGAEAEAVGGFCKVFSFFCLQWVQDQRTALRNIHSLLREGGEGFFSIVGHSPVQTAYETLVHQPRWSSYMTDLNTFISPYQRSVDPVGALTSTLTEVKLKVLFCREHLAKLSFPTIDEAREFLEAINPFVKRIPTEERPDFITDVMRETQKAIVLMRNVGEGHNDPKILFFIALDVHVEK